MKRLFILLSISLSFGTLWAAKLGPWGGGIIGPDKEGSVYVIKTPENLAWVAQQSAGTDFAGVVFRLDADLDMGGDEAVPAKWEPAIGTAAYPFRGEFDGNNHVIYNLYIMGSYPPSVGLFSETGEEAYIHHLGLAQGKIITDKTDNVGAFAGVNRGRIDHCFSMVQISAQTGSNIGGLVGTNEGTIEYSYNTGVITEAKEFVGGLVGYNKGTAIMNECYNAGYCKGADHIGALFGKNEAPAANLTKVYFDQQMTRMHVTGYGSADPLLDNSKFAILTTATFSSDKSPFNELSEWVVTENMYPRLGCFGEHEASLLSTSAIGLDSEKLPIERAEGVGAPDESKKPRKEFKLFSLAGAKWTSPNEDIIHIASTSKAEVKRPCGNQEVLLEVVSGIYKKQIFTIVKGYETFDPGKVDGNKAVCLDEVIKFPGINNGSEHKDPTGGKDDEQSNATLCYQYMIIRDTVITNPDGTKTYQVMDTVYWTQTEYTSQALPSDVPGEYSFRRYTHDAQCTTEWTESPGRAYLTVREGFDAGSLVEKPDTIYAVLPQVLTIESEKDASGGSGVFTYLWKLERKEWNPETQTWEEVPDNVWDPLYMNGTPVGTASFDYTFTKPGQYSFTRRVSEKSCNTQPSESNRPHIVVVFETLVSGSIESFEHEFCTPECTDTIDEIDPVTGGNGVYTYRWLCNGVEIPNSDTVAFLIERYQGMTTGGTYVFTRQVKDNTGIMDWQTSAGSVTIRIYRDYDPGAIDAVNQQVCYEASAAQEVQLTIGNMRSASGDTGAEFHYCWLLYKEQEGKDPVFVDTIKEDVSGLDMLMKLRDYNLSIPVTISIVRAVQNTQCASAWKISANKAVWRLGRSEKKTQNVTICLADLPYSGTYEYANGTKETYRFTEAGQTKVMNDLTPQGCPMEVTLVCKVTPAPEVEVKPVISVCESASALKIEYEITSGSPDRYDLTFPASMKEIGFEDVIEGVLQPNVIEVPLPADVPYGKYQFSVMFYAATAGTTDCKGEWQTQNFTFDVDGYVNRKGNDIIFVDNSGKHTEEGLTFDHYQWYRNNEPIEGETGQYYYEYNGLNGVYSVEMITADGTVYRSCQYDMRPMTPLEDVSVGTVGRKVLRDGQLFIIVGEKMYNMLGQEVQQ